MPIFRNPDTERCSLLPLYLTTAGIQNRQIPTDRPSGAPFHHIFFIEQGECVFEGESWKRILPAGTAVFIHKTLPIRYRASAEPLITAWVTFDGFGVSPVLSYFQAEDFSFVPSSALYSRIASIYHYAERQASYEDLSHEVYDLMISYFHEVKAASCPRSLLQAKQFMAERYRLDLSVEEIAQAAGISPSLLYRLFREHEKKTPIEALRQLRIQKAQQLLLSENPVLIRDVADQCGFSDAAYFCKLFREETGLSPSVFRSLHDTLGI